ncbi:hypothetical protein DPEC_G00306810, partial [Dallia pectoralis]
MTGKLAFLLVSLSLPCLYCQSITSIPSGPVLTQPGETLSLSCQRSGYTFSSYNTAWIRQPSGKPLEWMGFSGIGASYHSKRFDGRMETTKDDSNG